MERGQCGATLEEGDQFCVKCGAAVVLCPGCGEPAAPSTRLPRLWARTGWRGARPAPQGLVAERRVCSVLFCNMVGFTPLSEARDPEDRDLLPENFGVARTVIGRYGRIVEKFIGDAVMAVWGTLAATEGDA